MPENPSALREARVAVGLTRSALAVASGVSGRMVEAIERGECGASTRTWDLLETALLRAGLARIDDVRVAVTAVAVLDAAVARAVRWHRDR